MNTSTLSYKGRSVSLVSRKGSWVTLSEQIAVEGGGTEAREFKARASEVEGLPAANVKGGKGKVKAEKPAKAAKAAPAKKAPKAGGKKDAAGIVRLHPNLASYVVDKTVKTASGRASVDCGDPIAARLRGAKLEDIYREAAKATNVTIVSLKEKYGHLNVGMQRMNLGNKIRGAANVEQKTAKKAAKQAAALERKALKASSKATKKAAREAGASV